jgi:Mg-chelatase subunit ChlD
MFVGKSQSLFNAVENKEKREEMNKLNFYVERSGTRYIGKCFEHVGLSYEGPSYDAARSGIKRAVKRFLKMAKGTTVAPVVSNKRKINRVAFVIDGSGSMSQLMGDAVDALNKNIQTLRDESAGHGQETFVTVVRFSDYVTNVITDLPLNQVKNFSRYELYEGGNTALYDATGGTIEGLERIPTKGEDVAYLLVVITDGAENKSRTFSRTVLNQLISRVQATDRWTVTFLTPHGQETRLANDLGVHFGNVSGWAQTTKGVQAYSSNVSLGTANFYGSRAAGVNSVKTFYSDLSNLTSKDLKKNLEDIAYKCRVWTVEKEITVRDFVEKKGLTFLKGAAFYQLTKEEKKVQAYKELLVMEKGKNAVYSGDNARQVLGLPTSTVKIVPGNHSNFDIFVQSTSTNRKLVRGTKLIYVEEFGVVYQTGPSASSSTSRTR